MRKKKHKKTKRADMIAVLKASGFTDEQIKEHYKNKDSEEAKHKSLMKDVNKNKPRARVFLGLNTNSM